jgi:transposase-like protein
MSLSRRAFTEESKEGAVRRLELGASVTEVARACGLNPMCCTASAESFANMQ